MTAKITIGRGDFERYRYQRRDRPHWEAMAAAIDPNGLDWSTRRRLHRAVRVSIGWYRAWSALWVSAPRSNAVAAELRKVITAAEALSRAITTLGPAPAQLLSKEIDHGPIESLLYPVAEIEAAAARATMKLPSDPGGRPPDLPERRFIERLAETFTDHTDRKATRRTWDNYAEEHRDSRFVLFARAGLMLAGSTKGEGDKIDDLIRSALH